MHLQDCAECDNSIREQTRTVTLNGERSTLYANQIEPLKVAFRLDFARKITYLQWQIYNEMAKMPLFDPALLKKDLHWNRVIRPDDFRVFKCPT